MDRILNPTSYGEYARAPIVMVGCDTKLVKLMKESIVAPPPWRLTGTGYVLLYRFGPNILEGVSDVPPGLRGRCLGGIGAVMLVDYATSNVGPYQELLIVPGRFSIGAKSVYAIPNIYVSSADSVINGQRNWGIPKTLATFSITRLSKFEERIQAAAGNKPILDIVLRAGRLNLPFSVQLLPRRFRTISQPWQGEWLSTTLQASGSITRATLDTVWVDPRQFPNFENCSLLAAVKANKFQLNLPDAKRLPI